MYKFSKRTCVTYRGALLISAGFKRLVLTAGLAVLIIPLLFSAGNGETDSSGKRQLLVYAYDSFVAEWGPAGKITEGFEEETGIELTIQSAGDAEQVLSRVMLEADNPRADVIIGIDNNMLAKALEAEVLEPYKPENIDMVPTRFHFDKSYHLVPYDYGFFSIIYDSKKIENPPVSLEELTAKRYENKLILMDPRTSSPGLGFLLWTIHRYGEQYTDYWRRLKPSLLTVTEGWDAGYGLFTNGEAPLVLSYTTSPAYHVEYEDSARYKAARFKDGHYMQIEGMGIIKGTENRRAAEQFIEYMLDTEAQSVLPLTNWMFPVNPDVSLPDSFEYALKPDNSFMIDSSRIDREYETWIRHWVEIVGK